MAGGPPPAAPRKAEGPRCPTCDASLPGDAPFSPFCSERCRWIDLGRWFDEAYSVPGEAAIDMDGLPPLSDRAEEDGGPGRRDG